MNLDEISLPQGYELHELPPDYDGPLWIEGQLRQFAYVVCESDTELLRHALEAIQNFREWEMGQDYNSNRDTVLAKAFEAEEALIKRLEGEQ